MQNKESENPEDEELRQFIEKKGVVELILIIDGDELTFTEATDKVGVSSSTVSSRLDEGEELEVFKKKVVDGSGRSKIAYTLDELGESIFDELLENDASEVYEKRKKANKEFDEIISSIKDSMSGIAQSGLS